MSVPTSPAAGSLMHCKSDTNISTSSTRNMITVPVLTHDHASSEPNVAMRKRKRSDQTSKEEITDMLSVIQLEQDAKFTALMKEQNEKFTALMRTVQAGISTHTEQNKEIVSSVDFLGQKYEEMVLRVHTIEQEKIADRKYIRSLEDRLEQLERNQHSSSIEVRNVPKKTGETKSDLLKIISSVGNALNISIQPSEVRDVYRINNKNDLNQPIVANLSTVILRDKIIGSVKDYNKKYVSNKFNTANLKLGGPTKPVFVSESLTVKAKKLFFLAREFAKQNNYKYCWPSHGKIYLRRTDGAPLTRINCDSDLESLNPK